MLNKDILLNVTQLSLIGQALGQNVFHTTRSFKKCDRTLPNEYYRNYNHCGKNPNKYLDEYVGVGLFIRKLYGSDYVYHVTDDGIDLFEHNFEYLFPYTPVNERNLEWLKHEIDVYCYLSNYTFDSKDVINDFNKYYLQGYHMSHTMTGVVEHYKKELKKYAKY